MEGERAATVLQIGQPEYEVPLVARIQVLIRDREDGIRVRHIVLLQRRVDLCRVELEVGPVLSCRDVVHLEEVCWKRLFGHYFAVPLFLFQF